METTDPVRHLSIRDLAERYGVAEITVRKWNQHGTGPRRMVLGRHVRYRLADVLAWEESRMRGEQHVA